MPQSIEDRVVSTVDAQTTSVQPNSIPPRVVVTTLSGNGSLPPEQVRDGIQDAVDSGQLVFEDGRLHVPEGVEVPAPGRTP